MTAFSFPKTFRVRQTFDSPRVADVAGEVHANLTALRLHERVRAGESVAVTVGSRGIADLDTILRAVVAHLGGIGARPFLAPAMGSHGGATAEGQRELLASYGITEERMGCPIRSSMETVVVGHAKEGFPLHFDRLAFEADHVLLCNRIKPHTEFSGPIESGLLKMLLIGLGNHAGATVYHRAIRDYGFGHVIRSAGAEVLQRRHVLGGLAIVENAYDQTALIRGILPNAIEAQEEELLILAKRWLPRLPFSRADVLLIDQIGKDISGMGLDPNVVGRKTNAHGDLDASSPKILRIAVRALSRESHGNAIGIGAAEFCRSALLRQMDVRATRLNGLTSGHISAIMIPVDYETDREMLTVALETIGLAEPPDAKLLWISDTLHLDELECSAAYLEEAQKRNDLEILTPLRDLSFDADGNLPQLNGVAMRRPHDGDCSDSDN